MAIRELMAFKTDNIFFSLLYLINIYSLTCNLNKNETAPSNEAEQMGKKKSKISTNAY